MLAAKKKLIRIDESLSHNAFVFTINTALGDGLNQFVLPLPSSQTYDFTVYHGDGNSTAYSGTTPSITLNYSSGGIYQVSFVGKVGGFSFNNAGDKLKVTSVDSWGEVEFDYLDRGFYGCSNLTSIDSSPIPLNESIVGNLNNLFRGTKLTTLYADLLNRATNIEQFSNSFYGVSTLITIESGAFKNANFRLMNNSFYSCTNLSSIPSGLYDNFSNLQLLQSTHYNNISLTSLPENLLYNVSSTLTSVYSMFRNCRNLVLPSALFNLSAIKTNLNFRYFMNVASVAYSFTGTIQDVWNYATSAPSTNAFLNQTGITNYASIPNSWKGL